MIQSMQPIYPVCLYFCIHVFEFLVVAAGLPRYLRISEKGLLQEIYLGYSKEFF